MQVTRFPNRAEGVADRVAGFVAHLRMNGFSVGPRETGDAIAALTAVDAANPMEARMALATLLVPDADGWRTFDDLFDAYWYNAGRQKKGTVNSDHVRVQAARPMLWQNHMEDDSGNGSDNAAAEHELEADTDEAQEAEGRDGRLIATRIKNVSPRDLRELVDEDSIRRAEDAATAIARAIRDRRSRRRKRALNGPDLDMRRIARASLARGGEPVDLYRRAKPPRPMKIVALCDVSGSMTIYARVFLAFLRGLTTVDTKADAYLFHTRLLRITDALRDHDTLRAASRLSLMAEGFGGGTDISGSLTSFLDGHGARALDGRTVVVILSDGYCSSDPAALGTALARIRRKARRVVWLNPLKGWRDYAPVAAAMSAALPHLDAHLPANTLEALAALEPEFAKL
ncbi:MAG: VWA domain-containing protein [Pseudomonadota bacterium]